MKESFLLIIMAMAWCQGFSQYTFKMAGGNLKVNGSASVVLKNTQWVNNGAFDAGTGTVHITGDGTDEQSAIGGASSTTFYNLEMNKAANGAQLGQAIQVDNELKMTAGNLDLNGYDLTLGGDNGTIANESAASYIHGSAGGEVVKTTTLNAPSAANPGNIGATITSAADLGGTTIRRGHQPKTIYGAEGILRYYEITPNAANNDNLNATLRLAYLEHELNSIAEADLEPLREVSPSWHYYTLSGADGAANYVEADGINAFSTWTLAAGAPKVNAKALLQGPYAGAGLMSDNLRAGNLLPVAEPYTTLGYAHTGNGGGETVDSRVFNTTGNDAITDWVVLELRDKNDPNTVLHSRAALMQKDGDVTSLNGIGPASFPGAAEDDYYLVVRHRNHLGVRSAGLVSLSLQAGSYDFSSASSQAVGANPMVEVSTGAWALWGGNADGDNAVRATGPASINDYAKLLNYLGTPNTIITGAYTREDINMDGNVRVTGPSAINDYAKLLNILGSPTTIIFQQF